jgi:hypothetical protein
MKDELDDFFFWSDELLMIDDMDLGRNEGTESRSKVGFDGTIAMRRFAWNVFTMSKDPVAAVKAHMLLLEPMPEESVQRCHEMARDGIFVPPHPDHVWSEEESVD